jgi:uncharacterized protein YciI
LRQTSLLSVVTVAFLALAFLDGQEKAGKLSPSKAPLNQFVVLLKRGPNWIPGKGVSEQPLLKHGKYLKELMDKGSLQFAGPFLDDSGGLILLNATDGSEAKRIVEHDPAVMEGILDPEIRPFLTAFDATTGKSPFK